MFRLQAH